MKQHYLRTIAAIFTFLFILIGTVEAKTKTDKLFSLGQAAEAKQDWDKALDYYLQALDLKPGEAQYTMSARRARFQAGQKHMNQGMKLRKDGKLQEALDEFQKTLIADPSSSIAVDEIKRTQVMIQNAKRLPSRMCTRDNTASSAPRRRFQKSSTLLRVASEFCASAAAPGPSLAAIFLFMLTLSPRLFSTNLSNQARFVPAHASRLAKVVRNKWASHTRRIIPRTAYISAMPRPQRQIRTSLSGKSCKKQRSVAGIFVRGELPRHFVHSNVVREDLPYASKPVKVGIGQHYLSASYVRRCVSAISQFELTLKHHVLEDEIRLYSSRTNLSAEGYYFVAQLDGLLTARERHSYGLASWRIQDSDFLGTDRISPLYLELGDRLQAFDHAGGREIRDRPACSGSFRHRRQPGNSDYILFGEVVKIRLCGYSYRPGRIPTHSELHFQRFGNAARKAPSRRTTRRKPSARSPVRRRASVGTTATQGSSRELGIDLRSRLFCPGRLVENNSDVTLGPVFRFLIFPRLARGEAQAATQDCPRTDQQSPPACDHRTSSNADIL
jgi:tetratricopeptide (TPR) repeat protein